VYFTGVFKELPKDLTEFLIQFQVKISKNEIREFFEFNSKTRHIEEDDISQEDIFFYRLKFIKNKYFR